MSGNLQPATSKNILPNQDQIDLHTIIALKERHETDLAKITDKINACLALMINNNESSNAEFEALQDAEIKAAELLDRAETALVTYQPASAEEYGIQAIALIESLKENIDNVSVSLIDGADI